MQQQPLQQHQRHTETVISISFKPVLRIIGFLQFFFFFSVGQDIFNESSEEAKNNNNNRKDSVANVTSTPIGKRSELHDELLDRVKATNNPSSTIFRQQPKPAPRSVAANLFDSEPPEFDEVSIVSSNVNPERKPVNLFLDDGDDDFDIFAAKKPVSAPVINAPSATTIKSINLFDNDDDDDENEDALFGGRSTEVNKPKSMADSSIAKTSIFSSLPQKTTLFPNLFDDEPPEDDFDFLSKANSPKEETEVAAVAVVEKIKPNTQLVVDNVPSKTKINLFEDDEDEDDSFDNIISASIKAKATEITRLLVEPAATIEDVDDDDDDFDKLLASNSTKSTAVYDEPKFVEKPPPPVSKNLFDDESDFVDPFLNTPTTKPVQPEPQIDPVESSKQSTEDKPKDSYASSHLFDDLPPDDDDDFAPAPVATETKHSGEFYNDFSETVTAPSVQATKSQYSYLFSDEPPPDDDLFQSAKPKKTIEKDAEFAKKLNLFANTEKVVDEVPKAAVVTTKPKKLKIGNLDINVAALLPGAKRTTTTSKSPADAPASSDRIDEETESFTSPTRIAKRVDVENIDVSGRLMSLTKSRAKVQTRRPSTRRGRQQQYQKSIETADDSRIDTEEDAKVDLPIKIESEAEPQLTPTEVECPPSAMSFEEAPSNEAIVENIPEESTPKEAEETKQFSEEKPEIAMPKEQPEQAVAKTPNLSFLDDEEAEPTSDDDWLSDVIGPTKKVVVEETVSESNLFDDRNESNRKSQLSFPAAIETKPPPLSTSKLGAGLFDDDEDSSFEWSTEPVEKTSNILEETTAKTTSIGGSSFDEDSRIESNVLPAATESKLNISTINSMAFVDDKPPPITKSNSLFDDLEDDDDDFFGSESTPTSQPTTTKKESIPVSHTKLATAGGLFGDDDGDDDDDDLFGKPPPLPEPRKQSTTATATVAAKSTKSLFGEDDDNDDDDDLFGSSRNIKKDPKPLAVTTAKTIKPYTSTKKPSSGKLFSDSDDDGDDDLFGTKSKPTVAVPIKSVASNRITKAKASSVTDQDPLADLLK